ncbi:hypothetical protein OG429_38680 [Streptomyces sp. NBC_00190]|uniref:hypothetical protein n=1 Tax=unclassified Streptomyces TaxID=2593676 RepID=UPI002E2914DF|nr:hypothetical protein [Streptomyces sp. NBC_00190]WSZ44666.1 hypothetical protein OG239_41110 [Streptomyces sp. NBC_00868]
MDKVLTGILKEAQPELVVTSQEGAADIAAITRRSCTVAGWLHSVSASGMGVLEADFTSRSPRRSSSQGG